jgi:hypothetical protein
MLGDAIPVIASASGYETLESSFIVGHGGSAFTDSSDSAVLVLKRTSVGKPMIVEFEVTDRKTDRDLLTPSDTPRLFAMSMKPKPVAASWTKPWQSINKSNLVAHILASANVS